MEDGNRAFFNFHDGNRAFFNFHDGNRAFFWVGNQRLDPLRRVGEIALAKHTDRKTVRFAHGLW